MVLLFVFLVFRFCSTQCDMFHKICNYFKFVIILRHKRFYIFWCNFLQRNHFSVCSVSGGKDFKLDWRACCFSATHSIRLVCLHHADWYQASTRPRGVSKPTSFCEQAGDRLPLSRPQNGRSAAGSGGRPACFRPVRAGDPGQRLRVHRGWKHQADELRVRPQRNRAERWDRYEMWKVRAQPIYICSANMLSDVLLSF